MKSDKKKQKKLQNQFSTPKLKHKWNSVDRILHSLYHMIPNRNFAASAILAGAASQIHWKMGKEVVNYWTALDASVTPTINTEKYEQTNHNQNHSLIFTKNIGVHTHYDHIWPHKYTKPAWEICGILTCIIFQVFLLCFGLESRRVVFNLPTELSVSTSNTES